MKGQRLAPFVAAYQDVSATVERGESGVRIEAGGIQGLYEAERGQSRNPYSLLLLHS